VPAGLVLRLQDAGGHPSAGRRLPAAQGAYRPPPDAAAREPGAVLSALPRGARVEARADRPRGLAHGPHPPRTEARPERPQLHGHGAHPGDRGRDRAAENVQRHRRRPRRRNQGAPPRRRRRAMIRFVAGLMTALLAAAPARADRALFVVDLANEPASLDPHVQWDVESTWVY